MHYSNVGLDFSGISTVVSPIKILFYIWIGEIENYDSETPNDVGKNGGEVKHEMVEEEEEDDDDSEEDDIKITIDHSD